MSSTTTSLSEDTVYGKYTIMIPNNMHPFTLSYSDFKHYLDREEEHNGEFFYLRTLEVLKWWQEKGCDLVYIDSNITLRDMYFIFLCKDNLQDRAGDIQIHCGTVLQGHRIDINN